MPLYKRKLNIPAKSKFKASLTKKRETEVLENAPELSTSNTLQSKNADLEKQSSSEIKGETPASEIANSLSPTVADCNEKTANFPNESASFEVEQSGENELKNDTEFFKENAISSEAVNDYISKILHSENGATENIKEIKSTKKSKAPKEKKLKGNMKHRPKLKIEDFSQNGNKTADKPKKKKKESKANTIESSQSSELSISQKILLSQKVELIGPPEGATKRERLEWLQKERDVGLYVQCDNCEKFRYLPDVKDPTELPNEWYCFMNKDKNHNNCDDPEEETSALEEEDLIFNTYNAGSIVWAKLPSFPWWPAMVDDDPDFEQYYWLKTGSYFPSHYHVTFFDSELVSRSWVTPKYIKPFKSNKDLRALKSQYDIKNFSARLHVARHQAMEALSCSILERLQKYSFIARWPYEIKFPRPIKKRRSASSSKKKNAKEDTNKNNRKTGPMPRREKVNSKKFPGNSNELEEEAQGFELIPDLDEMDFLSKDQEKLSDCSISPLSVLCPHEVDLF